MIQVKDMILQDHLFYKGVQLFNYTIHYPFFVSDCNKAADHKINQFYNLKAIAFENYCIQILFPQAIEQFHYNMKQNYPIMTYEALSTYTITLMKGCLLSLYQDKYVYTGGAHGSTTRTSSTWDFRTGHMVRLKDLLNKKPDYTSDLTNLIIKEIKKQIAAGGGSLDSTYFDTYEEDVKNTFHAANFYLTPTDIVFYFQQYDIGPYSSGILEFPFSYSSLYDSND